MQRAEFTLNNNDDPTFATIRIDGREHPEWKFELHKIGQKPRQHLVAIARGPASQAIDTYKQALLNSALPDVLKENRSTSASDPIVPFVELTFQDLIPKNL